MPNNYYNQLQKAYDFLVTSQNTDGGWGYRRGGMSFVEPTAFALIALFGPTGAGGQDVPQNRFQAVQRGLTWLRAQQHSDGGWGVIKDDPISGWGTYPAIWMFNLIYRIPELASYYGKQDDKDTIDRGRGWILNKGREPSVDDTVDAQVQKLFKINSKYLGWSWGPGESGWVIPTSLALLALVVEDPATMRKSTEVINAKQYLFDRACPDGGWNVGNPWMLGKKLPATPDATVFALIAWRQSLSPEDFGPTTEVVNNGIDYINSIVEQTNSDHTRVLTTWALNLYKEPDQVDRLQYLMVHGGEEVTLTYRDKTIKKRTVLGQDVNSGAWVNSAYTTAIAALTLSDKPYYL